MVSAIGAGEHPSAADAQHRARPPAADEDTVHVDGVIVQILAVAHLSQCSPPSVERMVPPTSMAP
jgi:hypothetical protein